MRSISNPETEPPDRQLAEPVERMGGRKRHPVIGPDRARQAKFLERALEDREGEFLLRGRQRFTGQQVAAGEVRDRQRVAVPPIAEHELAFIVGAPQGIRLGGPRQRGAGRAVAPPPSSLHEACRSSTAWTVLIAGRCGPVYCARNFSRIFGAPQRLSPRAVQQHYVRHIEGWYAQKHPDEDFAETFAVWLTPRSRLAPPVQGWPAHAETPLRRPRGARAGRRRADRQDRRSRHHARRHRRHGRAVLPAGRRGAPGPDRHRARRAPGADLPDAASARNRGPRPISSAATARAGGEDYLLDRRAAADRAAASSSRSAAPASG